MADPSERTIKKARVDLDVRYVGRRRKKKKKQGVNESQYIKWAVLCTPVILSNPKFSKSHT